jgi:hypothetical protein
VTGKKESDRDKKTGNEGAPLPKAEIESKKHDAPGRPQTRKTNRFFSWCRQNRWVIDSVIGVFGLLILSYYTMQARRQADAMLEANRASADTLAEIRRSNKDATRAHVEFFRSEVDQIEDPRTFSVWIANTGRAISPYYVTERSCFDYLSRTPDDIPCPPHTALFPGRAILPLHLETESQQLVGPDLFERVVIDRAIRDRSSEMLAGYLGGRSDVYWFLVIRYADGIGSEWRRESCWYLTKRDPETLQVLTEPGQHYLLPCRGFPRETEITGATGHTK